MKQNRIRSLGVLMTATILITCGMAAFAAPQTAASDEPIVPYQQIEFDYRRGIVGNIGDENTSDYASFAYSDEMWLADAEELNADIAKLSVAFAVSAYYNFFTEEESARVNRIDQLFSKMDFQLDAHNVEITSLDDCNTVGYYIGHKEIEHKGEKYIVYLVPIKGTSGDSEWLSNMRMGSGDDHKGFHDAAEDVWSTLNIVVSDTSLNYDADHRIFLVTGHSRGAAVANIIAGWISQAEKLAKRKHIFGYTYACPAVSRNANEKLMNIYNFNNPADFVPQVPTAGWGYRRYGQTITLETSGIAYYNFLQQFQRVTGTEYTGYSQEDRPMEQIFEDVLGKSADDLLDNFDLLLALNCIIDQFQIRPENRSGLQAVFDYTVCTYAEDHYDIGPKETYTQHMMERLDEYGDLTNACSNEIEQCDEVEVQLRELQSELEAHQDDPEACEEILNRYATALAVAIDITGQMVPEPTVVSVLKLLDGVVTYHKQISAFGDNLDMIVGIIGGSADAHCMVTYLHWIYSLFCGGRGWMDYTVPDDIDYYSSFDLTEQSLTAMPSGKVFHPGCGMYISPQCFQNSKGLDEIIFPENVPGMQIGEWAFSNSGLTDVTVPDNVKYIGYGAFSYCADLQTASLGSADWFGKVIFRECRALKTLTLAKTVLMPAGEESEDTRAAIPIEMFDDYDCTITKVIVTQDTEIADRAFADMKNLEIVVLPENLERIGETAFYNCSKLHTAELPSTLREIGSLAFSRAALTEVSLPDSTETVGEYAYQGCAALQTLRCGKNLTHIGEYAFSNSGLTDVTVPDNVKYIGHSAFLNCADLQTASLGSADWFGKSIFGECRALKTLTLAKTVLMPAGEESENTRAAIPTEVIDNIDCTITKVIVTQDTEIANGAFAGMKNLEIVILPKGLERIGETAFSQCAKLHTAELPSTLREIGGSAFWGTALTEVSLPDSTETVGEYAYSGCAALQTLRCGKNLTHIRGCAFSDSGLTDVTVPDNVKYIGCGAFSNCADLQTASLGSADWFGKDIFAGCPSLETVTFAKTALISAEEEWEIGRAAVLYEVFDDYDCTIKKVIVTQDTEIANGSFANMKSLEIVILPETLERIGGSAFYNCPKLHTAELPSTLREIGEYAFSGTALKEVSLPDSTETIREYAYSGCAALQTLRCGKNLTHIGIYAFSDSGLTDVTVPDNVKDIGYGAFSGCQSLATITLYAPDCIINDSDTTLPHHAIIYGWNDSTAHEYAERYGRTFIPLDPQETTTTETTTTSTATETTTASTTTETTTTSTTAETTTTSTTTETTTTSTTTGTTTTSTTTETTTTSTTTETTTTSTATETTTTSTTTETTTTSTTTETTTTSTTTETTTTSTTTETTTTPTTTETTETTTTTTEPVVPIDGDMNGDGELTVADAILLIRYIGEDDFTQDELPENSAVAFADLNNDGLITIKDVCQLLEQLIVSE